MERLDILRALFQRAVEICACLLETPGTGNMLTAVNRKLPEISECECLAELVDCRRRIKAFLSGRRDQA